VPQPIVLPSGYMLTSTRLDDRDEYVRLLADGEVARLIPVIPQPYTTETADKWIRHRLAFTAKCGHEITFCIRSPAGVLAGSVGVDDLPVGTARVGELGYWLGADHRGRGIARQAVHAFIPYAFATLGLERLTAHTLHFNVASARILTGAGFELEDRLVQHTKTATGLHDTLRFSLLKRDWINAIRRRKA
jgi:[ribosomal protein S5]-alanine N-acetyltransferase